ncbi:MAG TPA: circularly permuted type 2 ATP-grasp protein [Bryobacteraceae bacterium]|nr:circularly permuted type 2 ATP-grasp protein [Bryobacteraceae bacterium]
MNQVDEAVARYHKLLESEPFRDLGWVDQLQHALKGRRLELSGKPVSAFLRPHFITRRQYEGLEKGAEGLWTAIDRMRQLVLADPALLGRLDLLPGERMLAEMNPGYKHFAVTGLLDSHINNGSMRFSHLSAETPIGVLYQDLLSDIFYDAAPMKEFRKRYKLAKIPSVKYLQSALLKAFRDFGGRKTANIGILEFKQPFETVESREHLLLAEYLTAHGNPAEVVSPEQLEYKNGVLRKGEFVIDVIYRRIRTHEFLVRYDLTVHPLIRAYREGAVCLVNSFRSDIAQRKAMLDLLTDETVTAKFPLAEKKAIRALIPTTRVMGERKVNWGGEEVDLPEYALKNRERLVLRPNSESAEMPVFEGAAMDAAQWERACKRAVRERYVVQEAVAPVTAKFPINVYGSLEMKEMQVDVHPHICIGKVQSCSTWLTPANGGFSTAVGITPTYLLDNK